MAELDLVIRGATVVDGTGTPPRSADVAVAGGRIVEVGRVRDRARQEIDADGAAGDARASSTSTRTTTARRRGTQRCAVVGHGVTTVVMGNCGVGFAPVHPADHELLIELMEGVEDIPGAALHEGLPWDWESFPSISTPSSAGHTTSTSPRRSATAPLRCS